MLALVGQEPTGTATATIRGSVEVAGTGVALNRAVVTLKPVVPTPTRLPRSVVTDVRGRFEFREVQASSYRVQAQKGILVPWMFGQQKASGDGLMLDIVSGEVRDSVDIYLPRGAVISGRVFDEGGDVVAGAAVSAMRTRYLRGRRQLVVAARIAVTDDTGSYRLYGVPPGRYQVAVARFNNQDLDQKIFYPGTIDPLAAGLVSVGVGQERSSVDILMTWPKKSRVLGVFLGAGGRAMAGAYIVALNVTTRAEAQTTTKSDGTFAFDLVSGPYRLIGHATPSHESPAASVGRSVTNLIVDGDTAGIVLTPTRGFTVSGQIRFDVSEPTFSPAPALTVLAVNADGEDGVDPRPAEISEDWRFALIDVAGKNFFRLSPALPAGWMLRSVMINGRDVTDEAADIRMDTGDVAITISNRLTRLTGRVTDDNGSYIPEYTVVVFPDDSVRWKYGSRFVAVARPGVDGVYSITRLPGDAEYLAIAIDYLEDGQEQDQEVLAALRLRAKRIILENGEVKTLDLRLTRNDG